jgi:hypothetical protein
MANDIQSQGKRSGSESKWCPPGCTPWLQWGSVVACCSTAVTTGFVRGHRAPGSSHDQQPAGAPPRRPPAQIHAHVQTAQSSTCVQVQSSALLFGRAAVLKRLGSREELIHHPYYGLAPASACLDRQHAGAGLAQLGGTGNKVMAYAVPSDVDLAIVLCQGNVAPSDDTQWPDLSE